MVVVVLLLLLFVVCLLGRNGALRWYLIIQRREQGYGQLELRYEVLSRYVPA